MALKFDEYRKLAEESRARGIETADNTKRDANAAAQNNFHRSQATYGQLAEQLNQAGLTGSGYSDNVTRDAYASRQEAYAASERTYADTLRDIEDSHTNTMLKINESEQSWLKARDNSYAELFSVIEQGWSIDDINNRIRANEFSYEQAASLYKKAGLADLTEDAYNKLMGITSTPPANDPPTTPPANDPPGGQDGGAFTGGPNWKTINDALDAWNAGTDEGGGWGGIQNIISGLDSYISSGMLDENEIADLRKKITDKLLEGDAAYLNAVILGATDRDAIKNISSSSWVDPSRKAEIDAIVSKYWDGGVDKNAAHVVGKTNGKEGKYEVGDDYKIVLSDETKYAVQSGEQVTDTGILTALSDVTFSEDDESNDIKTKIVYYKGSLYAKSINGRVYEVSPSRSPEKYSDLMAKISAGNYKIAVAEDADNDRIKGDVDTKTNAAGTNTYGKDAIKSFRTNGFWFGNAGNKFKLNPSGTGKPGKNGNPSIDCVVKGVIHNQELASTLNYLATGDVNEVPGHRAGFLTALGLDQTSEKWPGQIVVYEGQPYIFSGNGWCAFNAANGDNASLIKALTGAGS